MKHSRALWPIALLCCTLIGLTLPDRAHGIATSATPSATPLPTAKGTPPPVAGTPAPTAQSGPGSFTMTQTLSDNAQGMTIAFDGLAFLTGTLGADSFFPPGKVADFWGFQYLRDNDPSEMGHNTDFLTNASLNMLTVLSSDQKAQLITLAKAQVDSINQYGYKRFVLMTAFRRLLTGNLPTGTTGLDVEAVKTFSTELYHLDGEISYARAQVMGNILANLDTTQRAYLDGMVGKGMTSWPTVTEPVELRPLSQDEKVAVMTYAGDLFSWYAGSIDADVYFCPERQGTYFGSFYMKDAPAVGNPGYSIGTNITADLGNAFLAALTPAQAALVTDLVTSQKPALYEIVDRRKDVSTLLRQFIAGQTPDSATVLSLMDRYGALDGDIIARYATAFAQVGQSLSADQQAQLVKMRTDLLSTLAYPTGAYLFAQAIPLPSVISTDFLFTAISTPTVTTTPVPTVTTSVPTASGTPMPPTRTGTPLPTASGTPLPPTRTGTPLPTASGTPLPSITTTSVPTASGTPLPPTRTGTPLPTASGTPLPSVTTTSVPTASGTPMPTPTTSNLPTTVSVEVSAPINPSQAVTAPMNTSAGMVQITLNDLRSSGVITTQVSTTVPSYAPNTFTLLGTNYEISTSGLAFGQATLQFPYRDSDIAAAGVAEDSLRLLHFENGQWKDVTTNLDTTANIITGVTGSFSPFVLGVQNAQYQVFIPLIAR